MWWSVGDRSWLNESGHDDTLSNCSHPDIHHPPLSCHGWTMLWESRGWPVVVWRCRGADEGCRGGCGPGVQEWREVLKGRGELVIFGLLRYCRGGSQLCGMIEVAMRRGSWDEGYGGVEMCGWMVVGVSGGAGRLHLVFLTSCGDRLTIRRSPLTACSLATATLSSLSPT